MLLMGGKEHCLKLDLNSLQSLDPDCSVNHSPHQPLDPFPAPPPQPPLPHPPPKKERKQIQKQQGSMQFPLRRYKSSQWKAYQMRNVHFCSNMQPSEDAWKVGRHYVSRTSHRSQGSKLEALTNPRTSSGAVLPQCLIESVAIGPNRIWLHYRTLSCLLSIVHAGLKTLSDSDVGQCLVQQCVIVDRVSGGRLGMS